MKTTTLGSLIKKEFYQITRDPSSIIIVIVLPLILMFIFAYGINLDQGHFNVGLYMQGYNDQNNDFYYALKGNKFINAIKYTDKQQMEDDFVNNDIKGMIILQDNFAKNLTSQQNIDIQVIADGTEPNTAIFVKNYIVAALGTWQQKMMLEKGTTAKSLINVENITWFNKELKSRYVMLPGSVATIMTLIGIILTALVIAREWERGTMEAILTTKITKMQFLLSKYIPYFLLTLCSTIFCTFLCVEVFDVPFKGSYAVFLLSSSLFILCCLGQGFFISTTSKNQFLACIMAASVALTPAMMLSGSTFPIPSMPKVVQWITYIVPSRYFTPCIQNAFMAETIWSVIGPQCIYLGIYAIVMFILVYKYTDQKIG